MEKPNNRASLLSLSESMDEFIEQAKDDYSSYNFNKRWIEYTQRISSSNPFRALIALWTIVPALSQIIQMFTLNYYVESCYESDSNGKTLDTNKTQLSFEKCIGYNSGSLAFDRGSCDAHVSYSVIEFQICVFLCFLFYYVLIFKIFRATKYSIKMLGLNVKIAHVINQFHWILFGIVTSLLIATGFTRYNVQEVECTMGIGTIEKTYVTFSLSLSQNNAILAAIQMIMTFSCFYSLLYKHYKDPWLSYVSLKELLTEAEAANFNIARVSYIIEDPISLSIIQEYFRKFKASEKETIILLAAFEDLKRRGMVTDNCIESQNNGTCCLDETL